MVLCPRKNVFIDATGSLISTIGEPTENKAVYLYSAAISPSHFSVVEFLSADHRAVAIGNMFNLFISQADTMDRTQRARPKYVVVDMSFALINAVVWSFVSQELLPYMTFCKKVLEGS